VGGPLNARSGGFSIARIAGIPVRVDGSWLLIFALFVWSLAAATGGPFAGLRPEWRVPAAALTVLVLFACVVIHEAGHSLVARRYGIAVSEIVLFAFGGVSRLEREPSEPGAAARVALAGPATSFVLAAIFAVLAALPPRQSVLAQALEYLAAINAGLAIFNLLPAYPLDGGRVVHALAWKVSGNHTSATRFAGSLTTVIGYLAAVGGVMLFFRGRACPRRLGRTAGVVRRQFGARRMAVRGHPPAAGRRPVRGDRRSARRAAAA
jgi:Zn-dependent protease